MKNGTESAVSINQLFFRMFKPLDTTRNSLKQAKLPQDLNGRR
jgi:hypothetical protein